MTDPLRVRMEEQIDLFDSWGKTATFGEHGKRTCKVETFSHAEHWGEFESPKTIRIHEEASVRGAFIILFHEAAHAIWEMEGLGKKADEETVCERIAEGLARMVLGSSLEAVIAAAKAETWEIPGHETMRPCERLSLDCEGIEKAVAANKCVRLAPMDYQPADMFSHASKSSKALDWKPRNRYLVRQGIKAVRTARIRLGEAMEREPAHLWAVHFEILEIAEYSLRVRFYWRNGGRRDFQPPPALRED